MLDGRADERDSIGLVDGKTVTVELTLGDLRDIDSSVSKVTVQGARYPEHLQQLVGR
jgi:hypothetical protein